MIPLIAQTLITLCLREAIVMRHAQYTINDKVERFYDRASARSTGWFCADS